MNALAPIAPKLGALIPRLASDADGEIVATARAIKRTLERAGLDLNDLAAALTRELEARAQTGPKACPSEIASECLRHSTWRLHEADFLRNVQRFGWRGWEALTPKQANWLRDLAARAGVTA